MLCRCSWRRFSVSSIKAQCKTYAYSTSATVRKILILVERSGSKKYLKIETFYHSRSETNKSNSTANIDRSALFFFFSLGLKSVTRNVLDKINDNLFDHSQQGKPFSAGTGRDMGIMRYYPDLCNCSLSGAVWNSTHHITHTTHLPAVIKCLCQPFKFWWLIFNRKLHLYGFF